uniref:Transmembrane channel-like protein n=1 Tax=Salarias fasciatus TaxID=181472 RepID=A0A672GP89_SALFA
MKELVALSTQDRIRAIRDLPVSFQEKKHIRCVLHHEYDKLYIKSARQSLELWQGTLKEIGGKFGSSVLSYFLFLKWLLMFNVFSFLINFGFITIPLLVHGPSPSNVTFRGLEILTGAGYFAHTVLYYGSYSNQTLLEPVEYDMQLSYFFTIAVFMVLCKITLIYSMSKSFQENYVPADSSSSSAWLLLTGWDFTVINEKAVRQRKDNLRESLSESAQSELLTRSEKLKHFGVHLGCWILSTGLAVGCGAGVYFLCQYEQKTLLVPFVVSLFNLVIPLFYSLFNKFEVYSSQRSQIYTLVGRNVLLRMVILGVLCHYWMDVVAENFQCWESRVGQALYRLVLFDFFFLMLGSLFGEFLSNVIGTKLLLHLGVPEFDVARNVLDLIYSQTLAWIGIYFSPLLPVMQMIKLFILFYIKKVSLIQNCQPPRRSARAAQMQTIFIFLLFFPFFLGALSVVAYTAWSLSPSEQCGPFRGLNKTFSVIESWMEDVDELQGSRWAAWIYQNIILSQIFFFLVTLIVLVIIYVFWQVSQGRKELIGLLKQQIVNEGKDKSFLLDKLQKLQSSRKKNLKRKKKKRVGHAGPAESRGGGRRSVGPGPPTEPRSVRLQRPHSGHAGPTAGAE